MAWLNGKIRTGGLRLAEFWRASCRPWLTKRNLPYFVLLGLVAFVVASTLAGRRQPPAVGGLPAETKTESTSKQSRFNLTQTPAELKAALDASEAPAPADPASVTMAAANPAEFRPPCTGLVVRGRGWRRDDLGEWIYHRGVDLSVAKEAAVSAMSQGRALRVGSDAEGFTAVEIDHGGGWRSVYEGLQGVTIKTGDTVAPGQILGRAAADQVHFEAWRDGIPQDPLDLFPSLG